MVKVASIFGMSFLQLCFSFYIELFSYRTLTETYALGFQKWFDHEWDDLGVFSDYASSRRPHICIDWNLQPLLKCFFDDIKISRCLVWRVIWCVLWKCSYFWSISFSISNDKLQECDVFVSSSLFFSKVLVKLIDYFWKPHSLFSKICVNCLLMLYLIYCKNCASEDVNGPCSCTYSSVALRLHEMCLWLAETRK